MALGRARGQAMRPLHSGVSTAGAQTDRRLRFAARRPVQTVAPPGIFIEQSCVWCRACHCSIPATVEREDCTPPRERVLTCRGHPSGC